MASSRTYVPGSNLQGYKVEAIPVAFAQSPIMMGGPITAAGYVPTITLLAGAGSIASIACQAGYDMAGSFNLVSGTLTSLGGQMATVTFGQALASAPSAVVVTAAPQTGTVGVAWAATGISKTGFSIFGPNPGATGTFAVNYVVFR
jgi:hypothetical protein